MSVENMGNGYVKVGVKQEDLEASIAGLRQLKPILQAQVTRGNGNNTRQAAMSIQMDMLANLIYAFTWKTVMMTSVILILPIKHWKSILRELIKLRL